MSGRAEQEQEGRLGLALYLARRELARRYAGSLVGAGWALVFPVLQIALYWAVFGLGLRIDSGAAVPLSVMLIAGMVPWFALSEALTTMTASISGNAALVKRVVFPLELLPASNLIAAAIVHGAILVLAIAALAILGHGPGPHLLLLLYYGLCLAAFAMAVGTLLALANAAFRDTAQLLGPALILWFWATPIVWPADRLPPRLAWIGEANPAYYLVEGYRLALLGSRVAGPEAASAAWFWAVTLLLGACAWLAFRRFKRELGDML
jgi:ABC-type polysaccharide/polyol phosphate export permease